MAKVFQGTWRHLNFDGSVAEQAPTLVVWRPLTWKEFNRFQREPFLRSADIYETCVVEGPDLGRAPMGIVRWIAAQVLESNPFSGGFKEIAKSLATARKNVQGNYLLSAKAAIAGTFRYTFEEIDNWNAETFFERLAQAELLMNSPLEPANPSQAAAPLKKKPNRPSPSRF